MLSRQSPGDGSAARSDHQVEAPGRRDLVAVAERLVEVMHRVEKQHRDVGPVLAEHVDEHHAFGLEAGRDARPPPPRSSSRFDEVEGRVVAHVSISSSMARTASIARLVVGRRARRRAPAAPPRRASTARAAVGQGLHDHPGAGGEVGRGIDQDEAARGPVVGVGLEDDRPCGRDRHRSDLVQRERAAGLGRHRARALLQDVRAARRPAAARPSTPRRRRTGARRAAARSRACRRG